MFIYTVFYFIRMIFRGIDPLIHTKNTVSVTIQIKNTVWFFLRIKSKSKIQYRKGVYLRILYCQSFSTENNLHTFSDLTQFKSNILYDFFLMIKSKSKIQYRKGIYLRILYCWSFSTENNLHTFSDLIIYQQSRAQLQTS